MSDANDNELTMNDLLIKDAKDSVEAFRKDTREFIRSIPEKSDGGCPFSLEMMRDDCRSRGYIPKF